MKGFSPLVRRYLLFSHLQSFYNISIRRNSSSILSQISSFNHAKVASSNTHWAPFKHYIQGEFAEPYGEQGKESLNRFSQTFSKTFASIANAHRPLLTESSDAPKSINTINFLADLFNHLSINFRQQNPSFHMSVYVSYSEWISSFWSYYYKTLNHYTSERNSQTSTYQELIDNSETVLKDYVHKSADDPGLNTSTDQIVACFVYCMEEYLSGLVSAQGVDKELNTGIVGLVDQNCQEAITNDLQVEDWQYAWNQPFRGKSLMLLEHKLALNVNALQQTRMSLSDNMSRIIPIVQSSGAGKSRLAEEYVRDQFAVMLSLKNGHGFPSCDNYVSEYFKDATKLDSRFRSCTVANPSNLTDFDSMDNEIAISRFKDPFFIYHNPIYYGTWATKNPDMNSIPMPWAAAGRLRVACFLSGLFETMTMQIQPGKFDKLEHWRNNFLHSSDPISAAKTRRQFWFEVIKNALTTLRENNCDELKKWLLYQQHEQPPTMTNGNINAALKEILRPSMTKFFQSSAVAEWLRQCTIEFNGRKWDLPFVFIIDEAAYLYQTNHMHSFMWVLDQPMVQLLLEIGEHAATRFFVLMLGTHSQISHFAPHYNFPSERYFTGKQHIPTVFSALDWDSGVRAPPNNSLLESSADISRLVRWGRPLWLSYYNGRSDLSDRARLKACVTLAMKKLTDGLLLGSYRDCNEDSRKLIAFAVLALRIHLDLDFVNPSRASRLVSSKMRWLVDVDNHRKHMTTTYGSEPLLVEAAACIMNSYHYTAFGVNPVGNPVAWFLRKLLEDLNQGQVDRGKNGELTARLLLIMAKDHATRQVWWNDKEYLSCIRNPRESRVYSHKDFQPGKELYFQESYCYYAGMPCSSSAFYHRAVKVKDFLKVFLRPKVYNKLQTHFESQKKWKSLDNAYVNFTHFAPVTDHPDGFAFTKDGFFAGWQRHVAYVLEKNFPGHDICIPVAYRVGKYINRNHTSAIIISIKNRSGTQSIADDYLPRTYVEGVYSSDGKTVQSLDDRYLLRLTLHKLKFINPKGIPGSEDISDDAWIQTTEDMPFIAFAMSMGDTERKEDLFIGEQNFDYNSHRIAFGLRGLINTYNTYDDGMKATIRDINIRHDNSGRYPQSIPDYRQERDVLEESRKPLDKVFDFASYWELNDKRDEDSSS